MLGIVDEIPGVPSSVEAGKYKWPYYNISHLNLSPYLPLFNACSVDIGPLWTDLALSERTNHLELGNFLCGETGPSDRCEPALAKMHRPKEVQLQARLACWLVVVDPQSAV